MIAFDAIGRWNQVRWSRYSPIYLEPTFRTEVLSEKLDEADPRRYQPIKAAKNEQTSLVTFDDLIACVQSDHSFFSLLRCLFSTQRGEYVRDFIYLKFCLSTIN